MIASRWLTGFFAAAACWAATAVPATAQQALTLEAGKAWTHSHSGISIPAILAGTPRTGGKAYAADDLDISLGFTIGDAAESLSLYIFRNTNGAVPVWFSQAQWAVENRDIYRNPALSLAPQAFVPPGQTTASGIKAIYEPKSGDYRSTGVMLLPVGDWYVKVRASSQSRSPAELARWMDTALAQVKWPKAIAAAPEAVPVIDCPAPLAFPVEAQDAPKNGAADLMTSMLGMTASRGQTKPTAESIAAEKTARWCRDAALDSNQATYRRNADPTGYLLAIGDNGNGTWVGPDASPGLLADEKAGPVAPRFSITLMMAAQNINFVAQDRLPSPQRVIEILKANRTVTAAATWGQSKSLQVNPSRF
jgi:hypothetical protein